LGRSYQVGQRRLWLHRSGAGGPAVVFLPGANAVGLDYLNVHDRVAGFTTSVLYDRGGTGWSDPVALPRTAAQVATELHDLLQVAGVPGPYIFAAHSLSGAYARRYLQLYPAEVSGIVYLDAFWEEWDSYLPESLHIRARPVPPHWQLRLVARLSRGYYRRMFTTWPREVRERLLAEHRGLAWQRVGALERSNQPQLRDEITAAGAVPDVALIALTAMGIDPGMRLLRSKKMLLELNEGKRRLYQALAASVPHGEHRTLEGARHSTIHIDSVREVTQAIGDLWQQVR
jgi:pimeloyl-ACP methyl ester carboxylesterase